MSNSYSDDSDSYGQEGHDDEGKPSLQETTNPEERDQEEEGGDKESCSVHCK